MDVYVKMILTVPGCPLINILPAEVEGRLKELENVKIFIYLCNRVLRKLESPNPTTMWPKCVIYKDISQVSAQWFISITYLNSMGYKPQIWYKANFLSYIS